MTRLFVVARNDNFPAINHSFPPRLSSLRGDLAPSHVGKRAPYSAAPSSAVSATSPLRAGAAAAPSVIAFPAEGARSYTYDATAERWIVPPSGKKPDAGSAAVLRNPWLQNTQTVPPLKSNRPVPSPEGTGYFWRAVADCIVTGLGLAVFGLIGLFFLVLS